MNQTSTERSASMAKVSKSLMLNEDLSRLLDAQAKATGANFTRLVTAAIIQYLFTKPDGPEPHWMKMAVEIESGEYGVGDLPVERMRLVSAQGYRLLERYAKPGADREITCDSLSGMADDERKRIDRMYNDFKKLCLTGGDEDVSMDARIQRIVEGWAELRRRKDNLDG